MKVAKNTVDGKFLMDLCLLIVLFVAVVIYMESSAEFQELMTAIKYNSIEGFNDGLTALDATLK